MIRTLFNWIKRIIISLIEEHWDDAISSIVIADLSEDDLRILAEPSMGERAQTASLKELIEWYKLGA